MVFHGPPQALQLTRDCHSENRVKARELRTISYDRLFIYICAEFLPANQVRGKIDLTLVVGFRYNGSRL
jgi:hypothetical protein